ncbi:MAG: 2-dehydro-3-deoxygalactonokinase [Gemmatimonadales bacterium]
MIAIDWGTSSCRAYRLDPAGAILERRDSPHGIDRIEGTFAARLDLMVGDWLSAGVGPVVMSGMIGSRNGWVEVPYLPCPAGVEEIATGFREVRWSGHRGWIAPGLSCRDRDGVPEVMRGEETQLVGVLDQLPAAATVCLPGTHSKWVEVRDGRIVRFTTYLTGEVFATLRDHSILRHGITAAAPHPEWFAEGLARAATVGGLLHHLFGVRTRALFAEVPPEGVASYLSGILIGHELATVVLGVGPLFLLGAAPLTDLYRQGLASLGRPAEVLDPDAAARGLSRLARHLPER